LGKSITIEKSGMDIVKSEFREMLETEPNWLYQKRRAGWDYYHASPLPLRSDHLWRYTDPGVFLLNDAAGRIKTSRNGAPASVFLFSDGQSDLAARGVVIESLGDAIVKHGDLTREYLYSIIGAEFGKFEALNAALWDSGIFIYIPANSVIDEPIHIAYSPTSDYTARRSLIIIGGNSEVTIVDDYRASDNGDRAYTSSATEIFVGENSTFNYLCLNRLDPGHKLYLTTRAAIDSDVNFKPVYAGFGGENSKINIGTNLEGKGANSRMTGFVYLDGERGTDCHTRQHHKSGESFSDLDFKVVVRDRARSAYTGLIRIEKDAPNCEAFQENRNLLLNEGARAESIPELEILTDQVSCTHGATMGPVDPEMLFFMESRGISEQKAIKLIIEGFFQSTMAKSPEIFKTILSEEINKKLGDI
jgi:Fe-S cluster assembly protein SufD